MAFRQFLLDNRGTRMILLETRVFLMRQSEVGLSSQYQGLRERTLSPRLAFAERTSA